MNDAHLHMVVNHVPIMGAIFGLGILIAGLLLKNNTLKNTAYILFIIAAVFSFFAMSTGEGAEEIVEDFPNIGHQIIHEHEEIAEKFAISIYVLGVISLIGIYANFKNHAKSNLVAFIALTIALVVVILAQQVGTTGGEVRHTEIRDNTVKSAVKSVENKQINSNDEE